MQKRGGVEGGGKTGFSCLMGRRRILATSGAAVPSPVNPLNSALSFSKAQLDTSALTHS